MLLPIVVIKILCGMSSGIRWVFILRQVAEIERLGFGQQIVHYVCAYMLAT